MKRTGIDRMKKMKRADLVALVLELTEENEALRRSEREYSETSHPSSEDEPLPMNQTSEMLTQMKEIVRGMELLRHSIEKATVGHGGKYEKQ